MSSSERAKQVVEAAIDEVNQLRSKKQRISKEPDTVLFGNNGILDSLGLVNLIVAVEEAAEELFDADITLGQESSVAGQQHILQTVKTLTDHLASLLEDE